MKITLTEKDEVVLLDNFQRRYGEIEPYHYVDFSVYQDGTVFARLMMDEDYGANTLIRRHNMGTKENALKSWRDVKCPLCKSDVGFDCINSKKRKYGHYAIVIPEPHKARLKIYKSESA